MAWLQDASTFSDGEVELTDEWVWEKLKEWNHAGVLAMGYPLVNIQKAIENGH